MSREGKNFISLLQFIFYTNGQIVCPFRIRRVGQLVTYLGAHIKMDQVFRNGGSIHKNASDGREGFQTQDGFPSSAAIRTWLSQNKDNYRLTKINSVAKLHAVMYEHVKSFADVFRSAEEHHLVIFDHGDRL